MMFIDFGANDPNVDISGLEFESVNAIIVDQTTRFLFYRFNDISWINLVSENILISADSDFWFCGTVNSIKIFPWYQKSTCKDDHMTLQKLAL